MRIEKEIERMGMRVEMPPYALDLVTPAGAVGGYKEGGEISAETVLV